MCAKRASTLVENILGTTAIKMILNIVYKNEGFVRGATKRQKVSTGPTDVKNDVNPLVFPGSLVL